VEQGAEEFDPHPVGRRDETVQQQADPLVAAGQVLDRQKARQILGQPMPPS
jgi:hypothetical protein